MNTITNTMLDEWWKQRSFEEMEEITGYYQLSFSSDEGYQEFVDACDEYWDWLIFDIKLYYYKTF